MAHLRKRYAYQALLKLAKYWPVVGLLGLRQSGKSTLFRDLAHIENQVTLDDEEIIEDLAVSTKGFLAKRGTPLLIDEAQKSPALFEAIKLAVDRKKIPGSYFLTGSSQFSAKIGIRESLTGRIGILRLYPFTLGEARRLPYEHLRVQPIHALSIRCSIEETFKHLAHGALPVPLFARDEGQRSSYYQAWLETTVLRDVAKLYGSGYDPEFFLFPHSTIWQNFARRRTSRCRKVFPKQPKIETLLSSVRRHFFATQVGLS